MIQVVLIGAVLAVLVLLIVAGVPPVTVVVASLLGIPLAIIYIKASERLEDTKGRDSNA